MFANKCPMCGTGGKVWNKAPEVFMCPSCSSLFSEFGLVVDSGQQQQDVEQSTQLN